MDRYTPRPAAIFCGGLLTLGTIGIAVGLIAVGAKTRELLIGVYHPSPHLLPVDRASVAETGLTTLVKLGPDPEDPLRPIALVFLEW